MKVLRREGGSCLGQAIGGGAPEGGHLVSILACMGLAQVDLLQVVDLEQGDGVGC